MRKHPSFSFLYFHNFEGLREQEEELEKEEEEKRIEEYPCICRSCRQNESKKE
jgi:hypothetical protein